MMETLGLDEDMPIDQKILSNAIEKAQKRVEGRNFDVRKRVLQYDDVMNVQREKIYEQRHMVLEGQDVRPIIQKYISGYMQQCLDMAFGENKTLDRSQLELLRLRVENSLCDPGALTFTDEELAGKTRAVMEELLTESSQRRYAEKETELGENVMREAERVILLRVVDSKWMNHIDDMQELRQNIQLRAYAQQDPVIEYKREGFDMYEAMLESIREDTVRMLYNLRIRKPGEAPQREQVAKPTATNAAGDETVKKQPVKSTKKPGRNDPCPCGSGKKYKKCCGMYDN